MSEDVFIDMLEDDPFPAPQEKPVRRLNYAEKVKAGLVERRPMQRLRKVAKGNAARDREYREWVKIALHGRARCQRCKLHVSQCGELQPHHPSGRGPHLFEVVDICGTCHTWVHAFPNDAYAAGWLTPAYKGYAPNPSHPCPFTLLPPP